MSWTFEGGGVVFFLVGVLVGVVAVVAGGGAAVVGVTRLLSVGVGAVPGVGPATGSVQFTVDGHNPSLKDGVAAVDDADRAAATGGGNGRRG